MLNRLFTAILSYLIVVVFVSLAWHEIVNFIAVRDPNVPSGMREVYRDSFFSSLGLFAVLIFVSCLLYFGIVGILPKYFNNIYKKMILGFIAGLTPVIIVLLSSVGLQLHNPTAITSLVLMGLGVAAMPLVQRIIKRWSTS